MSLLSAGAELSAAVLLPTFIGGWLDVKLGSRPWLMLIGALVGVVGGMYRLWLVSQRLFTPSRKALTESKTESLKDAEK